MVKHVEFSHPPFGEAYSASVAWRVTDSSAPKNSTISIVPSSPRKGLWAAALKVWLAQVRGRGVTTAKASKVVRSYEPSRMAEKISIHDWLLARADKRCSASPPCFFVAAIQEDFPAPTGFLKSREQAKSELKVFISSAALVTPVSVAENQDKVQLRGRSLRPNENSLSRQPWRPINSDYYRMLLLVRIR